jgi:hypothetical protein
MLRLPFKKRRKKKKVAFSDRIRIFPRSDLPLILIFFNFDDWRDIVPTIGSLSSRLRLKSGHDEAKRRITHTTNPEKFRVEIQKI